jgi:uncharacterized protein YegJ (DUF2314 family)
MLKQFAGGLALMMIAYAGSSLTGTSNGAISNVASSNAIPDAAPGADPLAPRKVKNNVVAYHTADEAMNAAKSKARQTLSRFAKMWEDGVSGTYTVKFPLTQNGETEHIWLQVDGFEGNKISGRLANEPVNGAQYKIGQRMQIGRSDVEDWMVNQGDAIYGGYSARVAMAQMPKDERAKYEKLFRD